MPYINKRLVFLLVVLGVSALTSPSLAHSTPPGYWADEPEGGDNDALNRWLHRFKSETETGFSGNDHRR
jgi:hypothetical protein